MKIVLGDTINHKPQRAILSASWGFSLPSCTIPKPIPASCCMGLPGLPSLHIQQLPIAIDPV